MAGVPESHAGVRGFGGGVPRRPPRSPLQAFRPGSQGPGRLTPLEAPPGALQLQRAPCAVQLCPDRKPLASQLPVGDHAHHVFLVGSRIAGNRFSAWHQPRRHQLWRADVPMASGPIWSSPVWSAAVRTLVVWQVPEPDGMAAGHRGAGCRHVAARSARYGSSLSPFVGWRTLGFSVWVVRPFPLRRTDCPTAA